ncbi:MAG: energy-coupling factor transporter transmembrane protein EcfT [Clostridiales bacterium]|nr:energy-coupling factor transporter transmembrane protein EcfT [Clostridiales bacterium]
MKGLLSYVDRNSLLHRINPATKILLSILICVGCFACGNLIVLCCFVAFDLIIGAVGKIFPETLRLLKGMIKISVFLFILQVLFVQEGTVIVELPLGVLITYRGFRIAATVVLKLMGATMPLAMSLMMTKLSDLSNVMVSKFRIPYKYAFAITSAIRFIPAFSDDMRDIMEAQKARGVDLDTKNFFKKIGLIIPLCMPLIMTSVKKTDSASAAAKLRGFELRTRKSCYSVPSFSWGDAAVTLVGIAAAAVGIVF